MHNQGCFISNGSARRIRLPTHGPEKPAMQFVDCRIRRWHTRQSKDAMGLPRPFACGDVVGMMISDEAETLGLPCRKVTALLIGEFPKI